MEYTTVLWHHTSRNTTFAVFVENFGIKYFSKDDALHLINSVKNHYKVTID